MACYPQNAIDIAYVTAPVGATPLGVTLTAGAANTKGSYVELVASLSIDAEKNFLVIQASGVNGTAFGQSSLIDWATGAAASEVIKVANFLCSDLGTSSSLFGSRRLQIPLAITSGTRVAARHQCSDAGQTSIVLIQSYVAGDCPGIDSFTTIGANTGDSGATQIDPGGTANTKGSYTELVASSAAIIQYIAAIFGLGANTGPIAARWYIDIATGATASEVVLIPDLSVNLGISTTVAGRMDGDCQDYLTYIAASTRIAARGSSSTNDATDRLIDMALVTGTAPSEPSGGGEHSSVFA